MKGFFKTNKYDLQVKIGTERKIYAIILFSFLCMSLITAIQTKESTPEKKEMSKEEKRVLVDGNIEKTEYIQEGVLQRFIQKTKKENTVLVEYFDGEGKPEKQLGDYFAFLKEQDEEGNDIKTTYLGIEKQPINTVWGYGMVTRTYDEEGHKVSERYFDKNGEPVIFVSGYHEVVNLYENDRNVLSTYLDEHENPIISELGYAILRRTYYDEKPIVGKVAYEYYFDESDKPIAVSRGQFGIHNEYDEDGQLVAITYLDADGNAMRNNLGYAMIKKTYYENGSLDTETYYDEYGKPMALTNGQYGVKWVNGQMVDIDSNGRQMFALRNHLHGHLISVIVVALLITVLSLFLGKKANFLLLILFLLCIAYMTLLYRGEVIMKARLDLFWSYRDFFSSLSTRVDILNNIWLFWPLGTILFRLSQKRSVVIVAVLTSIGIELLQYVTGVGTTEIDDVISNGLGGMLGMWFGYMMMPFFEAFPFKRHVTR
ncbi:MAG: VanZ family protein [Lachnospiraceae bacterium]|nr:VanZ family protein [Lachnospiraceae bacterium]